MLKKVLAGLVTAILFVSPVLADEGMAKGEVVKVDKAAGKLTIKHGPIKKLDMDQGMTMVFRVADPAMLDKVKAGDKIEFDADRVNGAITVTKMDKAH
jgi:Cu/Ag efflux protein CusF